MTTQMRGALLRLLLSLFCLAAAGCTKRVPTERPVVARGSSRAVVQPVSPPTGEDDEDSTVIAFFQRPAEALRHVKLALRQTHRYAHPYYRAPFILVGEPK